MQLPLLACLARRPPHRPTDRRRRRCWRWSRAPSGRPFKKALALLLSLGKHSLAAVQRHGRRKWDKTSPLACNWPGLRAGISKTRPVKSIEHCGPLELSKSPKSAKTHTHTDGHGLSRLRAGPSLVRDPGVSLVEIDQYDDRCRPVNCDLPTAPK